MLEIDSGCACGDCGMDGGYCKKVLMMVVFVICVTVVIVVVVVELVSGTVLAMVGGTDGGGCDRWFCWMWMVVVTCTECGFGR